MTTYMLPSAGWAILLGPIVKDAQPGDVLECQTRAMYDLAVEAVEASGRDDLIVRLNELRKERAA